MNNVIRKSLKHIVNIYKDMTFVSEEWAGFNEEQLAESAEEHLRAASGMMRMQDIIKALYADRFGSVPALSEMELAQGHGLQEAQEYVAREMKKPFVLDPPTGLFARKPKKEDYYAFGRALQMMNYYHRLTASRQQAYAEELYKNLQPDLLRCVEMTAEMRENDVANPDRYEKYTRPDAEASTALFVGNITQAIEVPEQLSSVAADTIDHILSNSGLVKNRVIHVPCSYDASEPFVLFINHTYSLDHPEDASFPSNLLHNLIYQVVRSMPAYSYQFTYMDPLGAGNSLGELQGLTSVRDGNAFWLHQSLFNNLYVHFDLITNKDEFHKRLTDLSAKVGKINTIRGSKGTVSEYNRGMFDEEGNTVDGAQIIPLQIVIMENIHGILSADDCQKIETLISNADQCGVSLVIVSSRTSFDQMDDFERRLSRNQRVDVIDWAPVGATLSTMTPMLGEEQKGSFRYGMEPYTVRVQYPRYISSITEEMKPNLEVNTIFSDLFEMDKLWGKRDATDGIQVPVGVNERGKIVEITLGGSLVNGLLAGTIGCGKSSFLHTIINGILMYYQPQDVEIWLSDYKTVEFLRYTEHTPANITYVGTARTKEYSLALIDKIYEEYERRADLFGADQATSVREYRNIHGKDSMPRLLVIIDEFHVMSNHIKDEPDYSTRLGSILREARAMGISLLLSDQTCGVGLQGLKEDARLQLNCRMAMRTTIDEYNAVFNINNAAAVIPKTLNFEVVLKRETERTDENGMKKIVVFYDHVKTIFTPNEVRDRIAEKSIQEYGENEQLFSITSNLRSPIDWNSILEKSQSNPLRRGFGLFPGIPRDLKSFLRIKMTDGYNENLISIGTDDILQTEVMIHLLESLDHLNSSCSVRFLVSDNDDIFQTAEEWIEDYCRSHKNAELLLDEEEICRCIAEQVADLDVRRRRKGDVERVFLVWLGMPDLVRDMEHYPSQKPESYKGKSKHGSIPEKTESDLHQDLDNMFNRLFGDASATVDSNEDEDLAEDSFLYNASEDIRALLDEGARRGIHSLVFNTSVPVSRKIRCARFESFNHKIAFRMSRDDALDYLGNSKFILTPENEIIDEETGVYFDGKSAIRFVPFINDQIEPY